MASLRVGRSISPLLTMHGRFQRGKLERKRHMPMIQNVSLIEGAIQRGVEGGRICWKNGEQVYLNEALSTLDFRGEVVLGRKEFTQRVSVSVEVLPWSVSPMGSFWKGTSSLRLVHSLCHTLCRFGGELLLGLIWGKRRSREMERFLGQRGL